MNIRIVSDTISLDELKEIAKEFYRSMIKGAVDVEEEVIAFGGEYHIDAANVLAERGSKSENVWGFNIRFDNPPESRIEYTAMINIKPVSGNRNILIADKELQDTIRKIVDSKII